MDLPTLERLAIAASLAYVTQERIERRMAKYGITDFDRKTLNKHSVTFFQFQDNVIIAFRGTYCPDISSCVSNWKSNLSIIPTKRKWGWTHLGFTRAAESLWDFVQEKVNGDFVKNRAIYFTGHSLGGAMAVISALKTLCELDRTVNGLATFGQPPLAGRTTIRRLALAGLDGYPRVVCSIDLVVTGPFMPFFHCGDIYYFDQNQNLHRNMSWIRFFLDAFKSGAKLNPFGQINSHYMAQYRKAIRRLNRQRLIGPAGGA